jgi:hypothetical protein
MSQYTTHHGKTTSAKMKSGQKSTLTERDCHILRTVLKNHTTTAAQVTAELKNHLEDPMSDMSFKNPASTVGLQLLNL